MSLRKIGHIAAREFVATVATRGFIVGLLVMPVMITALAIAGPRLFSQRNFKVQGQIAIIDPTRRVAEALRTVVDPRVMAERRVRDARRVLAQTPQAVRDVAASLGPDAIERTLGQLPDLQIVDRTPDADLLQEKEWLVQESPGGRHLALVLIHPDALQPARDDAGDAYELYVGANLDDRANTVIQQALQRAIASARAGAAGLDLDRVEGLTEVNRVRAVSVTRQGEQPAFGPLTRIMPFAFTFLLFFGVMMGGQTLMTSTIEEKSSRVVEVLLSAVSPLELMAGKILGQMGVSLVALSLYVAMGVALLVSFALIGLVDVRLVFYLAAFFLITYLVIGSLMVGIGASVNELSEAQSLMGPIMIVLIMPLILQVPIAQDPNSVLSTVLSFVPPVNAFVMLIRMASSSPPPLWQVGASLAVGVAAVFGAVWVAAKVFRIGLLMYGKPPNFATLARWVRTG